MTQPIRGQVSLSRYPSGHGSPGSSVGWCVPVIHARTLSDGTTA